MVRHEGVVRDERTGLEKWMKAVTVKIMRFLGIGGDSGANSTGASLSWPPFLSLWSFNTILYIFTEQKKQRD